MHGAPLAFHARKSRKAISESRGAAGIARVAARVAPDLTTARALKRGELKWIPK